MKMLSDETAKPYFLRAVYEWCIDHKHAPYLLTKACDNMPEGLAKNGRAVFNISPEAVCRLLIADTAVSFTARFSGRAQDILLAMEDILAIYESDGGKGLFFPESAGKAPALAATKLKKPVLQLL